MESDISYMQVLNLVMDRTEKQNRRKKNEHKLSEIQEEEETSEISSVLPAHPPPLQQTKKPNLRPSLFTQSQQPVIALRARPKTFEDSHMIFHFALMLRSHKQAYNLFFEEAFRRKILEEPKYPSGHYYKLHMKTRARSMKRSLTAKRPKATTLTPAPRTIANLPKTDTYVPIKLTESVLQYHNESQSPMSKILSSKVTRSRKSLLMTNSKIWLHGQRRHFIDKSDRKIKKIFMKMCGGQILSSCRLDSSRFYEYLLLRYPEHIAGILSKYLVFNSASFEDYVEEMERLLKTGDEFHLQICFEAFDINKDKFICLQDVYEVMVQQLGDLYSSDLAKINQMFELKKIGKAPKPRFLRYREKSVASFCFDDGAKEADAKIKQQNPTEHPTKKEAFIFEEFCRIDFDYKPALLKDFYKYTCNFNMMKLAGLANTPNDMMSEVGEYILKTGNADPKDSTFRYFFDLEESKALFDRESVFDLFKKFDLMKDSRARPHKLITLKSLKKSFHTLFHIKQDYLAEKFYDFLSQNNNKDVTKNQFLRRAHALFHADKRVLCRFAFDFYDKRRDNMITIDEVHHFYKLLDPGSPVFNECQIFVDEYIDIIFDKKTVTKSYYELGDFMLLFPHPILTKEFVDVLRIPLDELNKRSSFGFLGSMDLKVKEQVMSSLSSLKTITHSLNPDNHSFITH